MKKMKKSCSHSCDSHKKMHHKKDHVKHEKHETKKEKKIEKVEREFHHGKLHSGSKKGPKVTNPKQALAIALSESKKVK